MKQVHFGPKGTWERDWGQGNVDLFVEGNLVGNMGACMGT